MPARKPPSKQPGNLTAEELIDVSVPASTPAHIRDWLQAIATGEGCETAQTETRTPPRKVEQRPARRRRRPGEPLGKSA